MRRLLSFGPTAGKDFGDCCIRFYLNCTLEISTVLIHPYFYGRTAVVLPPSSSFSRMKNNGSSSKLSRNANERLLKIHQLIAAQRFPNTFSLARDLEISRKTLKRDIQWMRDHWDRHLRRLFPTRSPPIGSNRSQPILPMVHIAWTRTNV